MRSAIEGDQLPGADGQREARVLRAQVGDGAIAHQRVLIGERRRLEPPVPLVVERPGVALAPPEVEDRAASVGRMAHEAPVHVVARRVAIRRGERPPVIRQRLPAVEEGEHAGDRDSVALHEEDDALARVLLHEDLEEPLREDRGAQVAHALGVDRIEPVDQLGPARAPGQPRFWAARMLVRCLGRILEKFAS